MVGFLFNYASKYTLILLYFKTLLLPNNGYFLLKEHSDLIPAFLLKLSVSFLLACFCWICMKVTIYLQMPFHASQLRIIEIIDMPATTMTPTKFYSDISLLELDRVTWSLFVVFF